MIDKKQTGGLEDDSQELIQPSDQELDVNNLINTVEPLKPIRPSGTGGLNLLRSLQDYGFESTAVYGRPTYGTIDKNEWSEYDRLIDGPFSLRDASIDDRRAEGQSFGEKALHGVGKFFPKTGAHILGSTYGLIDGLGEVTKDAYENGFAASNWNKFFSKSRSSE